MKSIGRRFRFKRKNDHWEVGPKNTDVVKVGIAHGDFPEDILCKTHADIIQEFIIEMIRSGYKKKLCPRFKQCEFSKEGLLILMYTHKDTRIWLEEVVRSYNTSDSSEIKFKIIDSKDFHQYTAIVSVLIPSSEVEDCNTIIHMLGVQNAHLQTHSWRILDIQSQEKGQLLTLLIDEPGRKVLEDNGFTLFLKLSTVTFEVVGKVERDEKSGLLVATGAASEAYKLS